MVDVGYGKLYGRTDGGVNTERGLGECAMRCLMEEGCVSFTVDVSSDECVLESAQIGTFIITGSTKLT